MHQQVTSILKHMAASQTELAKIIEAERHNSEHMARLVHSVPPHNPGFDGIEALTENAMGVTKSVAGYLNSLADLVDALGDNLTHVFKVVDIPEGEE